MVIAVYPRKLAYRPSIKIFPPLSQQRGMIYGLSQWFWQLETSYIRIPMCTFSLLYHSNFQPLATAEIVHFTMCTEQHPQSHFFPQKRHQILKLYSLARFPSNSPMSTSVDCSSNTVSSQPQPATFTISNYLRSHIQPHLFYTLGGPRPS